MSEDMSGLSEDLLSAYLDDELDASTRAEVDTRLAESAEWRAVLVDVRTARDAVRALPNREAPPGFWERVNDAVATAGMEDAPKVAGVVSLHEQRAKRRRSGTRLAAIAGVAAAAVIIAVSVVPSQDRTRPPVATFANQHAARSSLSNEPVSQLAGVSALRGP